MTGPNLTTTHRLLLKQLRYREAEGRPCFLGDMRDTPRGHYVLLVPTGMGTYERWRTIGGRTLRAVREVGFVDYGNTGPLPDEVLATLGRNASGYRPTTGGTIWLTDAGRAALAPRPRGGANR